MSSIRNGDFPMTTRYILKFLHTLGAIGLLGAMAALLVMLSDLSLPSESLDVYVAQRVTMAHIAEWLLLPSLGVTLVAGLFSMAFVKGFHNAGWAWLKLATGVVMFEGTLLGIQGPMEAEAERALAVALSADTVSASTGSAAVVVESSTQLAANLSAEWNSILVLGFVALVNVAVGIWRPRFQRRR